MNSDWIDDEGFRANVGIILTDDRGKLMLAAVPTMSNCSA
jgi:hypothetical protein